MNNPNNQNVKNNKVDYEILKQKVKLALLRKQMQEQEKQKKINDENNYINIDNLKSKKYLEKFLSKGEQNPKIKKDNNLLERTKKYIEEKKIRNAKKNHNYNYMDMQNRENKILYSLKNNLRDKNYNFNKNIIKPKLKAWKP